ARDAFSRCNRYRTALAQAREIINRVRSQCFLEPMHVVRLQHCRRIDRPVQTVRPEGIARAGIHHELAVVARAFTRSTYDLLVQFRAFTAPERSPAYLDRAEPLAAIECSTLPHQIR